MADIRARNIVCYTFLFILFLQTTTVSSQLFDCASLMMKVVRGMLKVYAQCSKDFMQSLENNQREYERRIDCVMKCVMSNIGLLDDSEKVTNDTVQVFFDKFVPEDYHEIGHIMLEGCMEDYSPLMDVNENDDDTCMAYGEYIKCVQAIIADAC